MSENIGGPDRETYPEDICEIVDIAEGLLIPADYDSLEGLEAKLKEIFAERNISRTDDPDRMIVEIMLELLDRKGADPTLWKERLLERQSGKLSLNLLTEKAATALDRVIEAAGWAVKGQLLGPDGQAITLRPPENRPEFTDSSTGEIDFRKKA